MAKDGPETKPANLFQGGLTKPDHFVYQSLGGKTAAVTAQTAIAAVSDSDDKKGVYGLFRSGDQSPAEGPASGLADKKGNCLGAIVWWGVSEAEALKACQDGRIGSPGRLGWWPFK